MKLNKHCWVTGGTKHSKDHFSLVIDIVLKTMPRGLLPRLSCICWLTESDWGIQSYTICFVFDTSESLRPKKKKKERHRGLGCWYKFSCHCPSEPQSRSAAQCREGISLKHLQSCTMHHKYSFLDHKHKSITRDVSCHTMMCPQLLFSQLT